MFKAEGQLSIITRGEDAKQDVKYGFSTALEAIGPIRVDHQALWWINCPMGKTHYLFAHSGACRLTSL